MWREYVAHMLKCADCSLAVNALVAQHSQLALLSFDRSFSCLSTDCNLNQYRLHALGILAATPCITSPPLPFHTADLRCKHDLATVLYRCVVLCCAALCKGVSCICLLTDPLAQQTTQSTPGNCKHVQSSASLPTTHPVYQQN